MSLSARVLHEECIRRGLRDEWRQLCKTALDAYHQKVLTGVATMSFSLPSQPVNRDSITCFEQARTTLSALLSANLQNIDMYAIYDEWRQSMMEE